MSSKGGQPNPQVIFFDSSSLQSGNFFSLFCWFRRLFNASHCHITLGCMTMYQTSAAFADVRSCRNGLISNSGGLGTSACVQTTQDPDGQKEKTVLCKMILLTQHTLRINFDYIASSVLALPCPQCHYQVFLLSAWWVLKIQLRRNSSSPSSVITLGQPVMTIRLSFGTNADCQLYYLTIESKTLAI